MQRVPGSGPASATLMFSARRRRLLGAGAALASLGASLRVLASEPDDADSAPQPSARLQFPRDHGSHPGFNTEWWYITGWAQADAQQLFGFQITFFRSRVAATQGMASRFAAKQLLFAHAAVTDVAAGRLLHDQRIARAGFGIAEADEADTNVRLRDWSLVRDAAGDYHARVPATDFGLALRFHATQPPLPQGDAGLSKKGPLRDNVSHYYSQPQLALDGQLRVGARSFDVASQRGDAAAAPTRAAAWLDREWSVAFLNPDAVGWDWTGMNLEGGAALMAFQVRDRAGNALWDGGSYRTADGALRIFGRGETRWRVLRRWTSPASGAVYPVEWALDTPAGSFRIVALVDDQELDSRRSTGAIYWEGLSDLQDARGGPRVGRGYLELTGYAGALRL